MIDFINIMEDIGILAFIKESNIEKARTIVEAVKKSNLNIVEIDYSIDNADYILNKLSNEYPEIIFAASDISSKKDVENAVKSGAKYVSTRDLNLEIIEFCKEKSILLIPFVSTVREVEFAVSSGFKILKMLAVESLGEEDPIKFIAERYKPIKIMVHGDVNSSNIARYMNTDGVISCALEIPFEKESLLEDIKKEDIKEILSEEIYKLILAGLDFRLAHVGINTSSNNEALNIANMFSKIFGLKTKEEVPSYFSGEIVEVMKFMGKGKNGHIAISTSSIERAVYYISKQGIEFDKESFVIEDSLLVRAYLKEEIAGFAVHLIRDM